MTLVTCVVYFIQWLIRLIKDFKFKKNRGKYKVFRKDDTESKTLIATMELKVKGNKIEAIGIRTKDNIKSFGKIEMSHTMPEYGTGYYRNVNSENHEWGFYEIQVTSENEILVHAPYQRNGEIIHQSFYWLKEKRNT